jgi:RNA polymerase sigma-70 factor (subfamily 1)
MMATQDSEADLLLERAGGGDVAAREKLLVHYQVRLLQMIRLRMDRRLAARVDPSDIVQETLIEAVQKLSEYLRRRPLPFYPWLRQLAWERLVDLHRRHVRTQKRSVRREERQSPPLPNSSAQELADRLVAQGSTPSARLARKAVELAPLDALSWQTLGWALYRTGAWKNSIEVFHKSMALQQDPKGGDSAQWFGLAVAHWQLANKEEARKWHDQAVQWMENNAPQDEQLRRFRTEAAELLKNVSM